MAEPIPSPFEQRVPIIAAPYDGFVQLSAPTCIDGCGAIVSRPGHRCRYCAADQRRTGRGERARVMRAQGMTEEQITAILGPRRRR